MESWPAVLGPHAEPNSVHPNAGQANEIFLDSVFVGRVCRYHFATHFTHSFIPYMITGDLSDQHWTSQKTNLGYLHRRVIKQSKVFN